MTLEFKMLALQRRKFSVSLISVSLIWFLVAIIVTPQVVVVIKQQAKATNASIFGLLFFPQSVSTAVSLDSRSSFVWDATNAINVYMIKSKRRKKGDRDTTILLKVDQKHDDHLSNRATN